MSWLAKLFGKQTQNNNDLQAVKLALSEKEKLVQQLKQDLLRERNQMQNRTEASLQSQMEDLFRDLATPLSQIHTQIHLLETDQQPLTARDLSTVAKRITRVMEDHGLSFIESVGDRITFDANKHEPLDAHAIISTDEKIIVRFCGISFQNKILRKAGVEKV